MPYRKIVPPATLIAVAILGTVALSAIDINIAINDPNPLPSGVRSDARLWITLLGVSGALWLAVLALLAHYNRTRQLVLHRLPDLDRTDQIPRIRIVGTAAVVEPQPAFDPKVVEMPSATTVAAMRRLAAKVTRADQGT